ncbi:MAG: pilus assembly protein PilP [Psychrobium sp.]|nr:pilus assembly protein PilP [Psychrobium sp.]
MRPSILLMLTLLLAGCGVQDDSVEQLVASVKQSKPLTISPLAATVKFEHFSYRSANLRSPFVAPKQELTADVISQSRDCLQPNIKRRKSSLESYALEALSMRGSLGNKQQLWALIQTHDGQLFKVKKGQYVGLFHGQVVQVSEQKIKLLELVPDGSGCWVKRENSLVLQVN